MPYKRALEFQEQVVREKIEKRPEKDVLILVEHMPVFTIGRHGRRENLLVGDNVLRDRGVEVFHITRGGDITYHGPGQLVVYPIFDLRSPRLPVRDMVFLLEEVMIEIAHRFGLDLCRNPLNRGVWMGDCKVGSVGIAIRRGISYHGLALNICVNKDFFSWINPCGLKGINIGSLEDYASEKIEMREVKRIALDVFSDVFSLEIEGIDENLKEGEEIFR